MRRPTVLCYCNQKRCSFWPTLYSKRGCATGDYYWSSPKCIAECNHRLHIKIQQIFASKNSDPHSFGDELKMTADARPELLYKLQTFIGIRAHFSKGAEPSLPKNISTSPEKDC